MKNVRQGKDRSDDVGNSATRHGSSGPPSHRLLPGLLPAVAGRKEEKGTGHIRNYKF